VKVSYVFFSVRSRMDALFGLFLAGNIREPGQNLLDAPGPHSFLPSKGACAWRSLEIAHRLGPAPAEDLAWPFPRSRQPVAHTGISRTPAHLLLPLPGGKTNGVSPDHAGRRCQFLGIETHYPAARIPAKTRHPPAPALNLGGVFFFFPVRHRVCPAAAFFFVPPSA